MPGRIKMPLTSLQFRLNTPLPILREARRRYAKYLVDDEPEDYFQTEFHRKVSARMTPGIWLKTGRDAHGLTQEELGAKLGGVSDKRISDWESGRRAIPKSIAKALANLFRVPAERFL
jgi:DNA-binding XRE family transcriptional regulator